MCCLSLGGRIVKRAAWGAAEQSTGYREDLFSVLEGESEIGIYGKDIFQGKLAL